MSDRAAPPEPCVLQHPAFAKLGEVSFRQAKSDGVAVLIVPLGPVLAAVPLRAIQAEFGINDESDDGRMLALVARALDFVGELRPGDPLPLEVLGGEASWEPDPEHLLLARDRLRLQLVALFDDRATGDAAEWARAEPVAIRTAIDGPGMAFRLQAAMVELAATLGLRDAAAATERVQVVAQEMSFTEALRARLLGRVQQLLETVELLMMSISTQPSGTELIGRVRRLCTLALLRIRARFHAIEAVTEAVLPLCRDIAAHQAVLRAHRDWLYCCLRAWDSLLAEWSDHDGAWRDDTWALLGRTYRFLAPRYMPVQEWALASRAKPSEAERSQMSW